MADPFKDRFHFGSAVALSERASAEAPFDRAVFLATVESPLREAELKARVAAIADGLFAGFGVPFAEVVPRLVALAGPPGDPEQPGSANMDVWPLLSVVERHGLSDPNAALDALEHLTRRFSAEFAIRPFLQHHPAVTWDRIRVWAHDRSGHLRRLASEGTRPRLPWGARVPALIADPSQGLEVCARLRADPVENVRDSVANHLNDVSRDHPDRVVELLSAWSTEPEVGRERLVRKAARGLVRTGHPVALRLVGGGSGVPVHADLAGPATIRLGETLVVTATLTASHPGNVVVDWILRLPGVRAERTKLFKGTVARLVPSEPVRLTFRLPMVPRSTRALAPGPVSVDVQVDGAAVATWATELLA